MMKKIILATLVALMVSFISLTHDAQAQSCSNVTGGDTTFTVCSGYGVDHFWSGTKVQVNWFDGNGASLTITNEDGNFSQTDYFSNGHKAVYYVDSKPVDGGYSKTIWVGINYFGIDSGNSSKVLFKINSNTTYDGSSNTTEPHNPSEAPTVTVSEPYAASYISINVVDIYYTEISGADTYEIYVELEDEYGVYQYQNDYLKYSWEDKKIDGYLLDTQARKYRVKVRAIGDGSNYGPWSDWTYFYDTFNYDMWNSDTQAPNVTVSANKYQLNHYETITVTGYATDNVEVSQIDVYAAYNGTGFILKTCHNTDSCSVEYGPFTDNANNYYQIWATATDSSNNQGYSQYITLDIEDAYYTNLSVPQFTFPVGDTTFYVNYTNFDWNTVSGATSYDLLVEYEYSSGNWTEIHNGWYLSDFATDVYLSNAGNYRAKVRAYDGWNNTSGWSSFIYFKYDDQSTNNYLAQPSITYPFNNQEIYHNSDHYFDYGNNLTERKLDVVWDAVSDADYYEITYEEKDSQGNWSYNNSFNVYGISDFLYNWLDTGDYRVKVRAVGNSSNYSNWSDWTYFEIYDHEGLSMSDSSGGDGWYTVLKGNSITHTPTGIKATVENVDHAVVYLRLENADKSLIYVKKNEEYWVKNSSGVKIYYYFAGIEKDGIIFRIHTDTSTTSTSPTTSTVYSRDTQRLADLKRIQTALELYYVDNGFYPLSYGVAVLGDSTHKCLDTSQWSGGTSCNSPYTYMNPVPSDPGNGNYIYIQWDNTYVIISTLEGTIDYFSGNVYATPMGVLDYFN